MIPLYRVERLNGEDPPDARYVVLDPVHDYAARVALLHYVTVSKLDHKPERAAKVEAVLELSGWSFRRYIESLNPKEQKRKRKTSTRR